MQTNLTNNEKYLLACSYGPDSMALFHMLLEENIYFEVVHVNYHILEQADDDEKGIREFCKNHNVKLHVLETHMPKKVNEEDWARTVRYDYFANVAKETGIKNVLVAQHIDDFIETYYLQVERGYVNYYGIKERNEYKGAIIIRPFATLYTKEELLKYVEEHNIPYSIDPSNLVPVFKRNKIRIEKINKMTREEKSILVKEILKKNQDLQVFLTEIDSFIINGSVNYYDFSSQFDDEQSFYLMLIQLMNRAFVFHEISLKESNEIKKVCESKTKNREKALNDDFNLYIEYGEISIKKKPQNYLETIDLRNVNPIFKIDLSNKNAYLFKGKYPLTIKPVNAKEKYEMNGKTLSVNRQFISWKVPLSIRKVRPGIYGKNGKLLYVPRYESGKEKSKGLIQFDLGKLEK